MVEARDSEIEFAAQAAELACTTSHHTNGNRTENGSSNRVQATITTPEKPINGHPRAQIVHAGKGEGYAHDHELLEVKSLSRNALKEIVLGNGGKKCASLKDKYFTLQAVEVKQF